ncbi:AMP-binding protein [Janibacter terrae]|uniref:AMP-binding protein n=1 Tax=Janibacter terrae TaxID=103817 RepID=UPI0031FA41BD
MSSTGTIPEYLATVDLATREQIEDFERTPLTDRGLPTNVLDYIRSGAAIDPDRAAIAWVPDARDLDSVELISHGQLVETIIRTTNLLAALGVRGDDVVSILTTGAPEPQYALWGAQTAGIANPLNWMLEPELLGEMITAVGARILVCAGGDDVSDPWGKLPEVLEHSPGVDTVIRAGGRRDGAVPEGVRFLELEEAILDHPGDHLTHPREITWETVAGIFGTGGTTGSPKLAKITHGGQIIASWAAAIAHQVAPGIVRVCASPFFHVHGVSISQLTTYALGGTAVLPTSGGWRGPGVIDNLWSMVTRLSIESVPLLPTIANRIVQKPEEIPDEHTVRWVSSGSAPLSADTARRFRELTGVAIAEGYGLTETSGAIVSCPRSVTPVPGIIGVPAPYHHAKVVQPGTTDDCGPGEAGELLLRGPGVFPGYLDPRQDEGVLLADGWLRTGDMASMDERGYLSITGRAKDVIIRGGHNIDPAPVEEALFAHPGVLEASVVAKPDVDTGEVPVAYIVVAGDAPFDLDDLIAHMRRTVRERASLPREYIVIDELPRSAVGKVVKNQLRLDAIGTAVRELLDAAGLEGSHDVVTRDRGAQGVTVEVLMDDEADTEVARTALATLTIHHTISARRAHPKE